MGANQSASTSSNDGDGRQIRSEVMRTCYYHRLEVERQATDGDIKKAYRKKALELHPDRNYGNVENATKLFAEVQAAYEVLSDPQERAWYDSHRDAILREQDEGDSAHYERNVRITTVDEIMRMFTRFDRRMDFSDSSTGFYGTFRATFRSLATEEVVACDWEGLPVVDYPDFGCANDSYDLVVKPFYTTWSGFATNKTFAWMDIYRYSEAPDRRVRRLMEKENKRRRDETVREFNDAVRSLVLFVRKRDPRYIPNSQTEAERQRILRGAAAAQATRSRAANRAKVQEYILPEWSKLREPDLNEEEIQESEVEEHRFECVACRKVFKSDKQFEAHERSRKHMKEIQLLQKTMHKESVMFDLNNVQCDDPPLTDSRLSSDADRASTDTEGLDKDLSNIQIAQSSDTSNSLKYGCIIEHASASTNSSCSEESDDSIPNQVENRIKGDGGPTSIPSNSENIISLLEDAAATSFRDTQGNQHNIKSGKAKEKRAKRAAQQTSGQQLDLQYSCATCEAAFPSKTRLFSHIKDFSHAQPNNKGAKGGHRKKR